MGLGTTIGRKSQFAFGFKPDIDHVVACVNPGRDGANGAGMVLARGRFNDTKIEALMRQHGARVETYNGKRLIVADHMDMGVHPQLPDSWSRLAFPFTWRGAVLRVAASRSHVEIDLDSATTVALGDGAPRPLAAGRYRADLDGQGWSAPEEVNGPRHT